MTNKPSNSEDFDDKSRRRLSPDDIKILDIFGDMSEINFLIDSKSVEDAEDENDDLSDFFNINN